MYLPRISEESLVHGWFSTPDIRGTRDILVSSLTTIWLCTWTSLCLNLPSPRERGRLHRTLLYKLRWQLFTIFFPEVLVATAAEQWLSARQSVRAFAALGHGSTWTLRHGFFADMGGLLVAPPDVPPFPVDAQQLAYLVSHGYVSMPDLSEDNIRALNKADGLARLVTLAQMAWFCLSCAARGATRLGFCTLEATTLAYILCTLHTFFFWAYKPLDPEKQHILPMQISVAEICHRDAAVQDKDYLQRYSLTPLDFVKPLPDAKSLITPFWFGLAVVFPIGQRRRPDGRPAERLPNSRILPQDGVSVGLMVYMLLFQVAYFGLCIGFSWIAAFPSVTEWYVWTVANATDFGLIAIYVLAIPAGTYYSPFLGRWLFGIEATTIIEVATALPTWAKLVIHAPFVLVYTVARAAVLVESLISLRALPQSVYDDVNWTSFLPHM